MTKKYFPRAYGLTEQSDINALYDDWAASYDDEVTENGYQSPRRCALALAKFAKPDAQIMDIGCGTGLSGVALSLAGFGNISGTEINQNMLAQAKKRGVYQTLTKASLDNPLPFETGVYQAITAVGVISSGAAPASLLKPALDKLAIGGFLCLSYNDHTIETPAYMDAISEVVETGMAEQVFMEYGPHLATLDVGSNVYVLCKK